MGIILSALIIAFALLAYVKIEQRVNQRRCPECRYRVSMDEPSDECPRCGSLIPLRNSD
jgi:rRNA maturation endonuclease Nob1